MSAALIMEKADEQVRVGGLVRAARFAPLFFGQLRMAGKSVCVFCFVSDARHPRAAVRLARRASSVD